MTWRFVLDETGRRELEAARIASDERMRLALDEMRCRDDVHGFLPVLPGYENHPHLDCSAETDGWTIRIRIYDPKVVEED